ncbi:MAG: rhomboid family intramembrane serine protease [Anaerolineales bacterium]|nr:rhomboid family intramembrane serine protease [Anaerolineales bacterium]
MNTLEPVTPSSEEQPQPPVRGYYIPQSKPVASRIVLGVLLVVFVIQILYGWIRYGALMGFNGGDIRVLVELGAKYDPAIYQGEYWRLFTATLLHGGVLHLMFNLYALFSLGPLLESYLGPARFLAIYVLGGLFGSLLSYAFTDSVSVGASGAIFGIFGNHRLLFPLPACVWRQRPRHSSKHALHPGRQPSLWLCGQCTH